MVYHLPQASARQIGCASIFDFRKLDMSTIITVGSIRTPIIVSIEQSDWLQIKEIFDTSPTKRMLIRNFEKLC